MKISIMDLFEKNHKERLELLKRIDEKSRESVRQPLAELLNNRTLYEFYFKNFNKHLKIFDKPDLAPYLSFLNRIKKEYVKIRKELILMGVDFPELPKELNYLEKLN